MNQSATVTPTNLCVQATESSGVSKARPSVKASQTHFIGPVEIRIQQARREVLSVDQKRHSLKKPSAKCRSANVGIPDFALSRVNSVERTERRALLFRSLFGSRFVFLSPVVFALKFLDSTRRVDEFLLAGEERVRCGTDIHRHHGERSAFKLNCFLRFDRRSNDNLNSRRRILEDDVSVLGVNALFHDPTTLQSNDGPMFMTSMGIFFRNRTKIAKFAPTATGLGSVSIDSHARKAFTLICRATFKMSHFIRDCLANEISLFPSRRS